MRTITVNIYKFDELSDTAKERAKQDYAADEGYISSEDAMASIKALAKHFDGNIMNWSIDWFNASYSSMDFQMPEMDKKEIGRRLRELGTYNRKTGKGHGECKLTGYFMDEEAVDGFRKAFRDGETDLKKLMDAAFASWLEAAQADCESFYEDEQFSDHCEANGYEFYEDGKFFLGEKERV